MLIILKGQTYDFQAEPAANSTFEGWEYPEGNPVEQITYVTPDSVIIARFNSTVTPTPTPTPPPVGACGVDYQKIDEWNGGFSVEVTIINNTASSIQGWELKWTFEGDETFDNGWNAVFSSSGQTVTASSDPVNIGWNHTIPANGGTVGFGFIANSNGNDVTPPSLFNLNGTVCGTEPEPPTPTLTPTPTPTPPALGDVNADGTIEIVDALMTSQYGVGLDVPGFHPEVADVNCDGIINIIDALMIARYYVGLLTEFPCQSN